jgi:hypothetical protein
MAALQFAAHGVGSCHARPCHKWGGKAEEEEEEEAEEEEEEAEEVEAEEEEAEGGGERHSGMVQGREEGDEEGNK